MSVLAKAMLVSILFAAGGVYAQGIDDLNSLAFLNGQCRQLTIGQNDVTADCRGKITNTAYKTGRTGFMFLVADQAIVTFSGADSPAIGNRASVSLDRVLISDIGSADGRTETLLATGTCTYSNPYAGPSHIECNAYTKVGKVIGSFVSDGQEPTIQEF